MRPAQTKTFEHTISGLLSRRADLLADAEQVKERLARIKNSIVALDLSLAVLGYTGDPKTMIPRRKREMIFGRRGLSKAILGELRNATCPVTNREIASAILIKRGEDPRDRTRLTNVMKLTAKALQKLRVEGLVKGETDEKRTIRWNRT